MSLKKDHSRSVSSRLVYNFKISCLEVIIVRHNFGRGPSNDHHTEGRPLTHIKWWQELTWLFRPGRLIERDSCNVSWKLPQLINNILWLLFVGLGKKLLTALHYCVNIHLSHTFLVTTPSSDNLLYNLFFCFHSISLSFTLGSLSWFS